MKSGVWRLCNTKTRGFIRLWEYYIFMLLYGIHKQNMVQNKKKYLNSYDNNDWFTIYSENANIINTNSWPPPPIVR